MGNNEYVVTGEADSIAERVVDALLDAQAVHAPDARQSRAHWAVLNSAPLRVWYSSAACPRQAHSWPSQYETSGRNTSALYRATARRAGWTVLEVQRTHALLPPLRDSPCGARHPYGALAETHVSMLLSSLRV